MLQERKYIFQDLFYVLQQKMFSQCSSKNSPMNKLSENPTDYYFYSREESNEVQIEREYLQSLKLQRQKVMIFRQQIELLYDKYDDLIQQLSKKNQVIKQQQKTITQLDRKYKDISLQIPNFNHLKKQNHQLVQENEILRNKIGHLESKYKQCINDMKNKVNLSYGEKQQITSRNEQLVQKIKNITKRMEQKDLIKEKQHLSLYQTLNQTKQQLQEERKNYHTQLNSYREELLKKDEENHLLGIMHEQMRNKITNIQENHLRQIQDYQQKIVMIQNDSQNKLKEIKQSLRQLTCDYDSNLEKLKRLKQQNDKLLKQSNQISASATQYRKLNEQAVYELKLQNQRQRNIFRQQMMSYSDQIQRLEYQINEQRKTEKSLIEKIRRYQTNEQMKRSIREIQKQQLEKINRLLF